MNASDTWVSPQNKGMSIPWFGERERERGGSDLGLVGNTLGAGDGYCEMIIIY